MLKLSDSSKESGFVSSHPARIKCEYSLFVMTDGKVGSVSNHHVGISHEHYLCGYPGQSKDDRLNCTFMIPISQLRDANTFEEIKLNLNFDVTNDQEDTIIAIYISSSPTPTFGHN